MKFGFMYNNACFFFFFGGGGGGAQKKFLPSETGISSDSVGHLNYAVCGFTFLSFINGKSQISEYITLTVSSYFIRLSFYTKQNFLIRYSMTSPIFSLSYT